jgi:hypothetical protein
MHGLKIKIDRRKSIVYPTYEALSPHISEEGLSPTTLKKKHRLRLTENERLLLLTPKLADPVDDRNDYTFSGITGKKSMTYQRMFAIKDSKRRGLDADARSKRADESKIFLEEKRMLYS